MEKPMKPILTKTDHVLGDTYEHPAFGMISYGRVSGQSKLVGSELSHSHYMRLTISEAKQYRNLHEDRFHEHKEIVKINLTEQQWATFISSPNTSGVPCTIRYRPDSSAKLTEMPPVEEENKHELAKKELVEYGDELTNKLQQQVEKLRELLAGGPIKKSDLNVAVKELDQIVTGIKHNMPFHVEQHKEMMEKNVSSAKSDIEGYLTDTIYRFGLEKLKEIAPQLEVIEVLPKSIE
jgi:hypothetical protein